MMTILADAEPTDMIGLLHALEAGHTTPAAEVEAAIRRAEAVNPQLNFIAWPTFERARAQARAPLAGPLAGVPTLVKDTLAEKGVPMALGSLAFRDFVPPEDAPYTRAMANAGLISIARSTMPELGLNAVTESPLAGPTRNPWSLEHTPGGSSGGGSAAVAAGVVTIASASDGLGSIRHGASPCGLVGLKPSRGRNIGEEAMRSITDLGVNGCVSRTVRDTAAWLDATQTRAPDALFAPAPLVTEPVDRGLRIHACSRIMSSGAAPDASVQRVFAEAVDLLGRLGHSVSDASLPFDGPEAIDALQDITEGMFIRRLAAVSEQTGVAIAPEGLEYRSRTLLAAGERIADERFARAWRRMEAIAGAYLDRLGGIDLWMTPTLSSEIVRIGELGPERAWQDQKDRLIDYAGYCWIDNVAGTPAISLPLGFSDNGLPVGVQFAAGPGEEALLIAFALQVEAAVQWWRRTPPIWVGGLD